MQHTHHSSVINMISSYKICQRIPYIIGGYNDSWLYIGGIPRLLLMEIPYHSIDMTDTVQYQILCIPNGLRDTTLQVDIHALECNYVVYDGPGIYSPQIGSSSANGSRYLSRQFAHTMYIEFYGSMKLCQSVRIEYSDQSDSYDLVDVTGEQTLHPYTKLHGENDIPIHCSNSIYVLENAYGEFHVQSSEAHNVWCRIYFQFNHRWNFIFEMDFDGPNIKFQDIGEPSCQFGDLYVLGYSRKSHAYCETISARQHNYNTRNIFALSIRFYSGYSSGRVKLKIFKTAFERILFHWDESKCLNEICDDNRRIWDQYAVDIGSGFSVMDDKKIISLMFIPIKSAI